MRVPAPAAAAVDLLHVHALVVLVLLGRVRQNLKRLANLLEALLRLLPLRLAARRVPVGVPRQRHFLVRLLDLDFRRALGHADDFVQVLAQRLLQLHLCVPQALRDGPIVGLELLRRLVVVDGLLVRLHLHFARRTPQQRLEVPRVGGERKVAISDGTLELALLGLCGGAVGVQRGKQVHQVGIEVDGCRVEPDGLVILAR
eukprot:scaffold17922_cov115-Isochrysis_galbana.AAC.1